MGKTHYHKTEAYSDKCTLEMYSVPLMYVNMFVWIRNKKARDREQESMRYMKIKVYNIAFGNIIRYSSYLLILKYYRNTERPALAERFAGDVANEKTCPETRNGRYDPTALLHKVCVYWYLKQYNQFTYTKCHLLTVHLVPR